MTGETGDIQAFLRSHAVSAADAPHIRKAGLVPYMRGPLRYYVMAPVAKRPELGLPDFQICKGTRMFQSDEGWVDMRGEVPDHAVLESLPETALREGAEELGVKVSNIARLDVMGEYRFTSATNRKEIEMWLLAAEMKNETDFTIPAMSTQSCQWLTLEQFQKQGRPDHAHILSLVEKKLCA